MAVLARGAGGECHMWTGEWDRTEMESVRYVPPWLLLRWGTRGNAVRSGCSVLMGVVDGVVVEACACDSMWTVEEREVSRINVPAAADKRNEAGACAVRAGFQRGKLIGCAPPRRIRLSLT